MADPETKPTADEAMDAAIVVGARLAAMDAGSAAREAFRTMTLRLRMLERQITDTGIGLLQDAAGKRAVPLPEMVIYQGGPMDGQATEVTGTHCQVRAEQIIPVDDPDGGPPMTAHAVTVVWVYHLYSDGTYRAEPWGDCPTLLINNPGEDGNGG